MIKENIVVSSTQLYRHFSEDGTLLYVGISLSTLKRLGQHKQNSKWFAEIVTVTIEHYDCRQTAAAKECEAIQKEKPRYNIAHVVDRTKIPYRLVLIHDGAPPKMKELYNENNRFLDAPTYCGLTQEQFIKLCRSSKIPNHDQYHFGIQIWNQETIDTWLDEALSESCKK